jgi:hypothetical protein
VSGPAFVEREGERRERMEDGGWRTKRRAFLWGVGLLASFFFLSAFRSPVRLVFLLLLLLLAYRISCPVSRISYINPNPNPLGSSLPLDTAYIKYN